MESDIIKQKCFQFDQNIQAYIILNCTQMVIQGVMRCYWFDQKHIPKRPILSFGQILSR